MGKKTGQTIMKIASAILWISVMIMFIAVFLFMLSLTNMQSLGVLSVVIFAGGLSFAAISFIVYGFGKLVDDVGAIRKALQQNPSDVLPKETVKP